MSSPIRITEALITLDAQPRDKNEAMNLLIASLVAAGKVDAFYMEGMKQREQQENTYLGQGVAIPHGTPEAKKHIKETAIAVLQVPQGLSWGRDGELAYVIVGIAARDDEHLDVLRRLTRILGRPEALNILKQSKDKALIAELLNSDEPSRVIPPAEPVNEKTTPANLVLGFGARVMIPNAQGIHARPATQLARLAKDLGGKSVIAHSDGRRADPSKMIEILSLGLTQGTIVRVEADTREALKQLIQAIESGLGEDLNRSHDGERPAREVWAAPEELKKYQGIRVSDGAVLGILQRFTPEAYELVREPKQSALLEAKALDDAIAKVEAELRQSIVSMRAEYGAIFEAHLMLLKDEAWLSHAVEALESGDSAAWAYYYGADYYISRLQQLSDPRWAIQARDVMDVRDRVVRVLLGKEQSALAKIESGIVCVDDLAPSSVIHLKPDAKVGLVLANAEMNSHVAILARGMNLPVVVVEPEVLESLPMGEIAMLDANNATLYLKPNAKQQADAAQFVEQLRAQSALHPNQHGLYL